MRPLVRAFLLLPAIIIAFVLIPAIVLTAVGSASASSLSGWISSAAPGSAGSITAFDSPDQTPEATPTTQPTDTPTTQPTATATTQPTATATTQPTATATTQPTATATPTISSTALPPTATPTMTPLATPTVTPLPQPTSPLPTLGPPTPRPTTVPPRPPVPQPTAIQAPGQVVIHPYTVKKVIGDRLSPTIYAFTSNGALYRSNQNGRIWALVGISPRVDDFLMSSADPNVLYSGKGVDCDDPQATNEPFFRSLDGGRTWTEMPTAINLRPLLIDPADPNHLFAADCTMLYLSTDGGQSWQEKPDNSAMQLWDAYRVVDMAAAAIVGDPTPQQPHWEQIYAIGVDANGVGVVAFSGDQGETWVPIVDPGKAILTPTMIVAHQTQAGLSWVVTGQGVWTTSDFGISWTLLDRGLSTVADANNLGEMTNAATGKLYLATSRGLYELTTGSEQWRMIAGTSFARSDLTGLLLTESNPTTLWINAHGDNVFAYRIPAD